MPLSPKDMKKYKAEWARNNPAGQRRYNAKRLYGLTDEEYDELESLRVQGCMICGRAEGGRRLSIDHNHETGKVRGLLCYNCNTGLGWWERNSEDMEGYLGN